MQMDTNRELLRKYFEGTCTPAELERLFQDLQTGDSEEYEEVMADIWEDLQGESGGRNTQLMFNKIRQEIQPESAPEMPFMAANQEGRRSAPLRWIGGIAAVLVLLLGLGLSFQWQERAALRTFQTAYGETLTVELPDGSVVMLNGNSSLQFAENQAASDLREAWLTGEAYFTVERKPGKSLPLSRFVVHTQRFVVEVVGTEFNVNDRNDKTQVVLHSGEVKILPTRDEAASLTMQPGQMVEASQADPQLKQAAVTAENYISWTRKELVFEKMPLKEIAKRLEDTYGFSVAFSDPRLGQLVFTGRTDTDELKVLWQIIERAFNLKIIQNENQIWIESR